MKFKKIIYLVGAVLLLNTSCGGFLDVNVDPNNPTQSTISQTLTGAQRNVGYSFSAGSYLGGQLPSYVFHSTSREVDNYGLSASYASLGNTWQQGYLYSLRNTEDLITTASSQDLTIYAGIGKLMKAYMFMNMTDLWGDIPYSEFYVENNLAPKVDKSQDIYNSILTLIDAAIVDLGQGKTGSLNLLTPSADDIFYAGNIAKWTRMANTLKLKVLVQSRKAKSDVSGWDTQLAALLAENNFMKEGEDFQLEHTEQDSGPDQRHPSFTQNYGGNPIFYINPWLYETMQGEIYNVKNNLFANIKDPRVPYYWYRQVKENKNLSTGIDYRDGGFVSIFFASNGTNKSTNQTYNMTKVGIYHCGGRYDDGGAIEADISDGNAGSGAAPEQMLQAHSVPFMLAELYLTGSATGNAKTMLEKGLRVSLSHINKVSQNANSRAANKQDVPELKGVVVDDFVKAILAVYDLQKTDEDRLQVVMTQKWIANFANPLEAYADIRRTGYPIVPTITTSTAVSPFVQSGEAVAGPATYSLLPINSMSRAMWYPNSEVSRNPHVSNARDLSKPILFWDK